ncbi:hypothetical protein GCM10023187_42890 [Nibrella viscosa]|uniref:DUF3575 domain-containing protein n=1 Tax=Nibrella viscosa TaxID=1084524 RepID=A0ABP8KT22_9BACT
MRNPYWLLLLLLCRPALYAQDSLRITYTQEPDTLPRQRFIDRYENVFMTKVPTRHMVKIGQTTSSFPGNSLQAGYEFKISPSFSAGINFTFRNYYLQGFRRDYAASVQTRWYYDMRRRIDEGKSSNNFTGNYIGAVYEYSPAFNQTRVRMGIEYGIQRRFLNRGFFDFGVGLFSQNYLTDSYYYWPGFRGLEKGEKSSAL